MGKIKKRGTSGQAKNFITRTQAVRKLQVTLPDFRRLCILKGIYPREPRSKRKASKTSTPSTTFYYTKDIQYLLHEPLLPLFRQQKSLSKKIGRLLGRGEVADAARLERTQTPRLKLDHIIKERYPTFTDALRDLDDALSLLSLFASLPATATVSAKAIAQCQRLCHEFEHYLIVSHSLRKSFISIKGIYYQATIQGQDILWLVPHKFVQLVTGDVDFRIMGTFVDFYKTLVGFVNFRLYNGAGLVYPPKFEERKDEEGAGLGALRVEAQAIEGLEQKSITNGDTTKSKDAVKASEEAQKAADALASQAQQAGSGDQIELVEPQTIDPSSTTIDTFDPPTDPHADTLLQPTSTQASASLFRTHLFYLSRETPRHPLELLLKAFGCTRVGWDAVLGAGAFTHDERDPRITHQVVDRPPVIIEAKGDEINGETNGAVTRSVGHGLRVPGRIYIQPQWVWDSVNNSKLMRADLYAPGATLPPHLSPFIKPKEGAYDPTKSLAELEGETGAEVRDKSVGEESSDEELDRLAAEAPDEDDEASSNPEGSIVADIESVKELADLDAKITTNDQQDAEFDDSDASSGEELDTAFSTLASAAPSSKKSIAKPAAATIADESFAGFSSASDSEASTSAQHELLAEARGARPSSKPQAPATKAAKKRAKQDAAKEEQLQSRLMMMPRRKRKLYERMQHGNRQRDEESERLVAKRRRLEGEKARHV